MLLALILIQLNIGNAGGTGKNLPQTAIVWGYMGLFALFVLWRTRYKLGFFTPTSISILVATLLLSLPWFLTRTAWQMEALWPLLGLLAGVAFYLSVLQFRWSLARLQRVLLFIVIATLLQAGLVLWQYAFPEASVNGFTYPRDKLLRPSGVFQQVNLLASFTATGLAVALLLYLTPVFVRLRPRNAPGYRAMLAVALLLLPMLLVILQSRIGWLGGSSAALLLLFRRRQDSRRVLMASALIVCGVTLGIACFWGGLSTSLTHENSNYARGIMLRETVEMILAHPWQGWGYGGFEYNFQHFRLQKGESTLGVGIATHPHNEYLYRWVEGGIFALAGMLILTLAGGWLFWGAYKQDKRLKHTSKTGVLIGLGYCLLPLVLHTQTEYPFYLSALHWGVFLLLLAIWDRLITPRHHQFHLPQTVTHMGRTLLTGVMLATLVFTASGGYSGWVLWRFEQQGFKGAFPYWQVNPWLLAERAHFDEQVASLLSFNLDRSEQRLNQYATWAKAYSATHIDREVYAHLVQVLRIQGLQVSAAEWGWEGYRFFPDDPRFQIYANQREKR